MTFNVRLRHGGPNGTERRIDGVLNVERSEGELVVLTDNVEYTFFDATILDAWSDAFGGDR